MNEQRLTANYKALLKWLWKIQKLKIIQNNIKKCIKNSTDFRNEYRITRNREIQEAMQGNDINKRKSQR